MSSGYSSKHFVSCLISQKTTTASAILEGDLDFKAQHRTTTRIRVNRQNATALSWVFQGRSYPELEKPTPIIAHPLIKETQ